ncbi:ribose-5-phosphate isomerase RpiA [Fulvimarina endophytica]|uniref:Ribose-5-phosphate isomerase A n=1 Tax=Fulvimarina endophytica TaxID=2293836 RepID=A0A371X754_9HYPH|nr:ribose-5-phosphate isomerase RpiA [Fulvimarina endophytica]RFC65069.1 ribose-5-phosphate isomerase RpiA [Fulvimarina endophytica]
MSDAASLKRKAAEAAAAELTDGMNIGIGTGSTAEEFVRVLAGKVKDGFTMMGVATSERTEKLCRELGVPLKTLDELPILDVTVDGADELDGDLRLVKGGGGALLREKIVAFASTRMIVIADRSKKVETLGAFPLPIEVNGFGLTSTFMAIRRAGEKLGLEGEIVLRKSGDDPYITDSGHLILDASFGRIPDPEALDAALKAIPGIVEHGLFIKLADLAILAGEDGIETIEA